MIHLSNLKSLIHSVANYANIFKDEMQYILLSVILELQKWQFMAIFPPPYLIGLRTLIQRCLPMIIECSSRIREWSVKMLISFYLHFLTTNLMLMKHPWVIKKRPVIKAHSVKGGSNSKSRRRRQSYVTCLLQKTSNQGWQGPFMVVKEAPREITFNGGPQNIK